MTDLTYEYIIIICVRLYYCYYYYYYLINIAGDPTTFGNLKPAKEVIDAVQESLASELYNGYAPCNGTKNKNDQYFNVLRINKH